MTSSGLRLLFSNGVVLPASDTPPVSTFLESHPGAYTTTRTHNNASYLLFWERHLQRLANSAKILARSNPQLLFGSTKCVPAVLLNSVAWEPVIRSLVDDSMDKFLPTAVKGRGDGKELAITILFEGNPEKLNQLKNADEDGISRIFNVHVHVGSYVPLSFGVGGSGACLAVVGHGRDVAAAKYSDWLRIRKPLEQLRPPNVTELLLSNDGDQILEGCVTNFFVVCRKDDNKAMENSLNYHETSCPFEVLTAPLSDGILPGVVRQLVIEVCLKKGIPIREVTPSWSKHHIWEEAFITNGLRVVQHVEKVQVPSSWKSLESKTWKEIAWKEKVFEGGTGMITTLIQKGVMEKAVVESYPLTSYENAKGS